MSYTSKKRGAHVRLRRNTNPSPGGVTKRSAQEMMYCVKSPAKGVLKGLLLDKNPERGKMPSLPSS